MTGSSGGSVRGEWFLTDQADAADFDDWTLPILGSQTLPQLDFDGAASAVRSGDLRRRGESYSNTAKFLPSNWRTARGPVLA